MGNALLAVLVAWCLGGGEMRLPDDPAQDVRPGFRVSCRVKLDRLASNGVTRATFVKKGDPNVPGSYWLRASGAPERNSIDFFVNLGDGPEPRVSSGVPVKPGVWYGLAAGWDGTNIWLTVDGKTVRRRRTGNPYAFEGELKIGSMEGELADLRFDGGCRPAVGAAAGFLLGCDVSFARVPEGENLIVSEKDVYLLRYDRRNGRGAVNFFVRLDGSWEPRVSFPLDPEPGRTYRVVCGWDGVKSRLSVDDRLAEEARTGLLNPVPGRLMTGTADIAVSNVVWRNDLRPRIAFGTFRSGELMPRQGRPFTVVGELVNSGAGASGLEIAAKGPAGTSVAPACRTIDGLKSGERRRLEWTVDAGTNDTVNLRFAARMDGCELRALSKGFCLMPEKDPDFTARAWNPPIAERKAFYVDSIAGDDAADGLTPRTAWRSFRNVNGMTLGPGARLLLRRGSVFEEELRVSAAGAPDNWAEIGAYGDGMRPQIRRHRDIDERCGLVESARYVAVRDLVFRDAGSGLCVWCGDAGSRGILVECCLAHHIEGIYRSNAHGIPEWRDRHGAAGKRGSRSCGIGIVGGGRDIVLRDCETYQCSSGFCVGGTRVFVNRMFCHDNYAHNTSPHPYNLSSLSWMTDCVFDASGWQASAGTMGVMLAGNVGFVIRNCHFLNQPDSGSHDQGGIDFEAHGDNCLVDRCTFRNNAGASIEVLGLRTPQARNVRISRCRFDRNNYARKNGPAEVSIWGTANTDRAIACSNGLVDDNGYVLVPGVPFYRNDGASVQDWKLSGNREFDFPEELDRAYPWGDPPTVDVCGEIWTDRREAALAARVAFNPEHPAAARTETRWEQVEGPPGVTFAQGPGACAKAALPAEGDYRVQLRADDGIFWRTARTAIHVLPAGTVTFRAWDFSRNLDDEGWRVENAGTDYEYFPADKRFWDTKSHPVRIVCGDCYVIAMKDAAEACIVTPDTRDVGVSFSRERCDTLRIRMQNHTGSRRMRLWWQRACPSPKWSEADSVAFDVTPEDDGDAVYSAKLPPVGEIKRLKLAFSADGVPVTGTCRIDYIWLGNAGDGAAAKKEGR